MGRLRSEEEKTVRTTAWGKNTNNSVVLIDTCEGDVMEVDREHRFDRCNRVHRDSTCIASSCLLQ